MFFRLRRPRIDHRTRTDHTEQQNQGFRLQMQQLTDAYMVWSYQQDHGGTPEQHADSVAYKSQKVRIVNIYGECIFNWGKYIYLHLHRNI